MSFNAPASSATANSNIQLAIRFGGDEGVETVNLQLVNAESALARLRRYERVTAVGFLAVAGIGAAFTAFGVNSDSPVLLPVGVVLMTTGGVLSFLSAIGHYSTQLEEAVVI